MSRTITYMLRGRTSTHAYPKPTVDPVVARALAQVAANDATRVYEEAAELASASPDDEVLQRRMQQAYNHSISACDAARKLR